MKRIIDANLNRATEAARVLEEIARFYFGDENLSSELKNIRHQICSQSDKHYSEFLMARDTQNDVGTQMVNPSLRKDVASIFKANIKRLQQALRTLAEYSTQVNMDTKVFEELRYLSYTIEKQMWERLSMELNKYRLADKQLYLVTNSDKFDTDDDFFDAIASALKGGVQVVQLREKNATAARVIELGRKIRELCSIYNALFIVNDRVDVAKIVEADGVHLGQDDIDIHDARAILGTNFIVGISTHMPEQAKKAQEDGADYIGVGPVFETPTKEGRQAVGLAYVNWASENIDIPFFAIGGIDLENAHDVIEAGAKGVAVVRAIINAPIPENAAKSLLEELQQKLLAK